MLPFTERDWGDRPTQDKQQSWNSNRRTWVGGDTQNEENLPEWFVLITFFIKFTEIYTTFLLVTISTKYTKWEFIFRAVDNAEACGGTFDSSGAFHGYSNDDTNLPKNQDTSYREFHNTQFE